MLRRWVWIQRQLHLIVLYGWGQSRMCPPWRRLASSLQHARPSGGVRGGHHLNQAVAVTGPAGEFQAQLTIAHITPSLEGKTNEYFEPTWRECLASQLEADLVVIGREAFHGVLGRLRTIAYSIIRQSSCPVMSV
jgi:hypothetical protein